VLGPKLTLEPVDHWSMLACQITGNFCPIIFITLSANQLFSQAARTKGSPEINIRYVFSPFSREEKTFKSCVFPLVSLSGDCTFTLLKYKTGL